MDSINRFYESARGRGSIGAKAEAVCTPKAEIELGQKEAGKGGGPELISGGTGPLDGWERDGSSQEMANRKLVSGSRGRSQRRPLNGGDLRGTRSSPGAKPAMKNHQGNSAAKPFFRRKP